MKKKINKGTDLQLMRFRTMRLSPVDDLEMFQGPHPSNGARQGVFLKNKNRSKGCFAVVSVTAHFNLTMESLSRTSVRPRWPMELEVRIPPGGVRLLGFGFLNVWEALVSGDLNPRATKVDQIFAVQGAYEWSPPYIPNEDPLAYLFVYSVPMYGYEYYRWSDILVNTHPNRDIEVDTTSSPDGEGQGGGVPAGSFAQRWASSNKQSYRVNKIKFV